MRKSIIALALTGLVGAAAVLAAQPSTAAKEVVLYKTPQCGCCENYANYLRDNNFTVTVKPTFELAQMSREAGIPDTLQGCHLAFVDGYTVSGHVPLPIVAKLLDERPAIKGITLPGMPTGSPGMGGTKTGPFTVYAFGDGAPAVYAVE
jgi:hypothetical protein